MNVYLSGGMEYANNDGGDWREELQTFLEKELHHEVFNPTQKSRELFATKYKNVDFRKLKFENIERYTEIVCELVEIDSEEIVKRSDYVICYWDESAAKGAGTKGELTLAKYFGKPVYLVTEFPLQDIPGWVLGCCTKIFRSWGEVKGFLINEIK
ncbi:MAG: hypothetical protein KGZ58_10085 [Ignavibacteriales bacterium]|nr:hypothetical protein [Ignavibacteriales bacterium]